MAELLIIVGLILTAFISVPILAIYLAIKAKERRQ